MITDLEIVEIKILFERDIPVQKSKLGFLEVIKKPHSETINSNLYAYFLSCGNRHVDSIFMDSLFDRIQLKSNKKFA